MVDHMDRAIEASRRLQDVLGVREDTMTPEPFVTPSPPLLNFMQRYKENLKEFGDGDIGEQVVHVNKTETNHGPEESGEHESGVVDTLLRDGKKAAGKEKAQEMLTLSALAEREGGSVDGRWKDGKKKEERKEFGEMLNFSEALQLSPPADHPPETTAASQKSGLKYGGLRLVRKGGGKKDSDSVLDFKQALDLTPPTAKQQHKATSPLFHRASKTKLKPNTSPYAPTAPLLAEDATPVGNSTQSSNSGSSKDRFKNFFHRSRSTTPTGSISDSQRSSSVAEPTSPTPLPIPHPSKRLRARNESKLSLLTSQSVLSLSAKAAEERRNQNGIAALPLTAAKGAWSTASAGPDSVSAPEDEMPLFPGHTPGVSGKLLRWHEVMRAVFASAAANHTQEAISLHPMFAYPPTEPAHTALSQLSFWSTKEEPHTQLWKIDGRAVDIMSWNATDCYPEDEEQGDEARGRWCFIVIRGLATAATAMENSVAPFVVLAFPASAITKKTEVLHPLEGKVLRRTVVWCEKAGKLPLIEGFRTDLKPWRPVLDAFGRGELKLVLFCEAGKRVSN